MATIDDQLTNFVVTSERANPYGLFSTLKVLWSIRKHEQILPAYARPPYPMIMNGPTLP